MGSTHMAGSLGNHCPCDRSGDTSCISCHCNKETCGNGRTRGFLVIGVIYRVQDCRRLFGSIFHRCPPCLDRVFPSFYQRAGSSFDGGYKGGSGRIFYYIDPDMGTFPQFIFYHFFFDCIACYLYKCVIWNRKYKSRTFGNGKSFQGSAWKAHMVYLFIRNAALLKSRLFRFPWFMLESGSRGGGDRYSCRFDRGKAL